MSAVALGNENTTLHILVGGTSLCGQPVDEREAVVVTRDSLFCSGCWDAWNDRHDTRPLARRKYERYLSSDVWDRTRAHALEFYGESCCLCGSSGQVDVHHRTYDRLGRERLADLIVLCHDCHAKFHGKAA